VNVDDATCEREGEPYIKSSKAQQNKRCETVALIGNRDRADSVWAADAVRSRDFRNC
jgi:hypothetical protein